MSEGPVDSCSAKIDYLEWHRNNLLHVIFTSQERYSDQAPTAKSMCLVTKNSDSPSIESMGVMATKVTTIQVFRPMVSK